MAQLSAGQNSELGSPELTFTVQPARASVAALVLTDQRRAVPDGYLDDTGSSRHPGVDVQPDRVLIDLGAMAPEIGYVLCAALDPQPGADALSFTLTDGRGQSTEFTIAAAEVHPVIIGFELYRRGTGWKVRAVGQGYAGGAAEMARAHGITATATPVPAPPAAAAPITPLGDQNPLERISMIYEDAARSSGALLTARTFAADRLETEMSNAVADPATRNTAAGQDAMTQAQRRHDDLIAAAAADYQRDAAHLAAELEALDGELPAALASWASPVWQRPPQPSTGIRLGVLTMPDVGTLTIPMCLQAPMRRPVWIDTREPAAAAPVLASLLTRLLAAAPHDNTAIDIIDLADTLGPLTEHLRAYLPRPAVTDHTDAAERLQHLVTRAELASLPDSDDASASIVVITDPGYGFSPDAIGATVALINSSVDAGISVVFVGDHADAATSTSVPLLREIAEFSHHIRVDSDDSGMLDPWTHNAWRFIPDTLAPGPQLADVIGLLSAGR
ncbi:stress response protein SCP2 [Mycobacterium sp. BK086]|uniref:TerD family protein n=1 Tax=Mycobacterium sp. BK086 TaxID=2512165 RepID=UPI00105BBE32|nr:TerD family protein [Mycobacterium sp. BK086]TDO17712.1 stress response protein SCP2 [Mycobacterium sp. BK086]